MACIIMCIVYRDLNDKYEGQNIIDIVISRSVSLDTAPGSPDTHWKQTVIVIPR